MRKYKKTIITFVGVILFYFGILPFFWPSPKATAELPDEHPYNQDLDIKIEVFAWHKNVNIREVRFYVDYQQTTAHGPEGPLHPMRLFHIGRSPHRWSYFTINRFTWPRSKELDLTLPLTQLAQEGVVKTGVVRGKLDVSIATPRYAWVLAAWVGYLTTERTQQIPFTLHLVDKGSA